ncbi:MAG: glycosyltransferase family 4 protein, partial [Verrucomicrobia bacterium]|nr:glycosyltransferase family 4 protein [Verrucomicrobiota bacterium]
RPDVIVVETDPPVLGLIGLFFARLYRAKFVFYLQDLYPDVGIALGQLKNGTVVAMLKASTRRSLLGADSIVVLGEDMKKRILDKGYRLNGRVRVIPNWADTTQVRPWQDGQLGGQRSVEQRMGRISIGHEKAQGAQGRNPFRQQHQLDGQFVVMFSGNIGLSQGLDRVIEVAGALADNPTIRFVLIGEGAAKAGLVERVKREELGNVLFLPYQPKEKLSESLSAADVHLVTLRRGLAGLIVPSKVYGIMAVGRPFIAAIEEDSHVAGIIREHRCGIRVEPDSTEQLTAAILWAVAHRDELEAMGQRGREAAVTQYDRKISVGKFRAMLEELRPEVRSQGSEAGD